MNSVQRINRALKIVQGFILEADIGVLHLARHPRSSIRAMARARDVHPEILRRKLMAIGRRREEICAQLALCFRDIGRVWILDPTYTKDREERLLVIAVLEEFSGKAVPVWWSYQSWEEMRQNPPLSRNLMVEGEVRKLKKTLGHSFVILADREFGSKRFRTRLKKMGMGYVLRLRRNDAPGFGDEHETLYQGRGFEDSWRLVSRKQGGDPVKLYRKRMRIEALFRDLKSLFGMRSLLRRISNEEVKEGLVVLMMLAWLFVFLRTLLALAEGLISQKFFHLRSYTRGEISIITLGLTLLERWITRLRSPCATGLSGDVLQDYEREVLGCVR